MAPGRRAEAHARSAAQRLEALRKANEIRIGRAQLELCASITILIRRLDPVGPALAVGLGLVFAYAAAHALHTKRDVPCGCGGATTDTISRATVVRGLVIAALGASLLLNTPSSRSQTWVVIAALALAGAAIILRTGAGWRGRARRRSRVVFAARLLSGDGSEIVGFAPGLERGEHG